MYQNSEEESLTQYVPLVHKIVKKARRSLPHNIDEDELISFGMMGLLDAFRKYNQREDVKFETYATQRIRGEIYDGLRRNDPLSRTLRKKEKEVYKAYEKLEQKFFRQPTVKEVSSFLNISPEECEKIITQSAFDKQYSLYEPIENGEESQMKIDLIPDQYFNEQSKIIEEKERKQQLISLIDELPEKERIILSLIYYENLSMNDIGRILGLHKSRISQIHSQVLKKLRKVLENEREYI